MTTEATSEATKSAPVITVRACKYGGAEHRRWPARVIRREGSLIVLDAKFAEEIRHDLLGTIARGTVSIEYYWLDRWYNIFRFAEPGGRLRNHYCNINIPPTYDGQVLSYIDLDIDIVVAPDFSYRVVDEDEFESNAALFNYPPDVRRNARRALADLIALIESHQFPFNERA